MKKIKNFSGRHFQNLPQAFKVLMRSLAVDYQKADQHLCAAGQGVVKLFLQWSF